MNEHVRADPVVTQRIKETFIDCDVHPTPARDADVLQFLPKEWHEFHALYRNHARMPLNNMDMYPGIEPNIARRDSYPPEGGPPGSNLDFMREQHLDPYNVEIGILQPLSPNGGNQRNLDYGAALASAVNDWQLAYFVDEEPRLRASLTVCSDNAEAAVAEIRRRGNDTRFAQVGLNQRASEAQGRRRYWPVYAAAQDYDLPLGIHGGGNSGAPPLGGAGWASFHIQQHQAGHPGMAALLLSLLTEGVFEEFKSLRVLLVEGAFSWLPSLTWRLDRIWEKMRSEMPSVKRPPSEYIRERVWISSQPMDVFKDPAHLRQVIDWIGWDRLCLATDYPHWDFDDPQHAFPVQMTPEQKRMVFTDNARAALRL
jgi:predicted TIM-barrel fold metal-dependent hydrolase